MKSRSKPQSSLGAGRDISRQTIINPVTGKLDTLDSFLEVDLDECQIPYAKVGFIHPRSGKHEFVEFHADGKLEGCEWIEKEYKPTSNLKYFLAGMLWTGAIWAILWAVLNG